ncbi:hypothetical protein [uncultured Chryseobacterium sp.]|uniref:hypothetical protein n=1 Tax=uncultured Chryseobacterium sp. TaxID=259322 RepID=UPI0025DF4BEF|nr:hypothetical protein [uncultured Chryseobacterium sp.]
MNRYIAYLTQSLDGGSAYTKEQSKAAKPLMKRMHKAYASSDQLADLFFVSLNSASGKSKLCVKKSFRKS